MTTFKATIYLLGAFMLATSNGAACAGSFPEKTGYVIDSNGNAVKNSYGDCWRTGYWAPALAIEECDPGLVKKEKPEVPMSASPTPAPVARETKLPVVAEKIAAAAREKPSLAVYFNAETLFDFDMAVVKPAGQEILDEKIVVGMKKHPEVALLIITGHADRIGTEEYNQGLSERRANAVKAYLVKRGIAAERMSASGKGESEPSPQANTKQICMSMKDHQLIACLQPDRRVTVESQTREAAK